MATCTPFVIAAGLVAMATGATSCGMTPDESEVLTEVATPGDLGEVVILRYAIWDHNQTDLSRRLIDLFESRNPHIRVEFEVIELKDYWNVLADSAAGRGPIDVAWMNAPNFGTYASAGSLLSMQSLADTGRIDVAAFPDSLIDLYSADGELFGVSKDMDTVGLFYNPTLFDAAGVNYPTENWTWADLRAAAVELTTDDVWGFGAATDTQTNLFPVIAQNGGQVISADGTAIMLDSDEACEAVEWLYRFQADGLGPSQLLLDDTNQRDLFIDGRVAMIFDGSWQASQIAASDLAVEVAPLPSGEQRANIVHGLAWVALSRTRYPKAAREFITFLASAEAQLLQAESGAVISSRAGTQQAWVDEVGDSFDATVFIDEVAVAQPYPTSPAPGEWITVTRSVIRDGFRGVFEFPEVCSVATDAANLYIQDELASR